MKAAAVAKFRLGGQDFAVVPWGEYQRLTGKRTRGGQGLRTPRRSAEDAGDAAEVKRRSAEPNKPYAELRRKLGLA
jgi:hypothetical protein